MVLAQKLGRLLILASVRRCLICTQSFNVQGLALSLQPSERLTICFAKQKQKGGASPAKGFASSSSTSTQSQKPAVRSLSSGQSGSGTKVLRKAALLFDSIRKEHGVSASSDVYVRSPSNNKTTFWFVGKIAYQNGATAEQAAVAQKRLIFEYSKLELRPQNLGGPFSHDLELWLAPGDSEMDTVQNKVNLEPVIGSASALPDNFDLGNIGFNPEIYVTADERLEGGLRVQRDEHGKPTKSKFDVNLSA
ncbi:hypothetical protein MPSEU_000534600 [Mayamaea pseudoterrestris]|nr:hypothetical protein MPSEU_000534600 [Mayamaea pseudoterrestris]